MSLSRRDASKSSNKMVQSTLDGELKKKNLEKVKAHKVMAKSMTNTEKNQKNQALLHEYLKELDNFRENGIISAFKAHLIFQEQMEQEVDDKSQ